MAKSCRLLLLFLLVSQSLFAQALPEFVETTPFVSGQGGYNTYRIPAIVRSTNGTLLAFCEGRKTSGGDSGDIDIVLCRSTNNGASWLPLSLVQEEGGTASITIGNPAPVVDAVTGQIHLLFCRNNDRIFHTVSTNDGLTWSTRNEITVSVKLTNWGWFATGPGHGIQLTRGAQADRLVVACDFNTTNGANGAMAIISNDHGITWQTGAINNAAGGVNPNETECIELVPAAASGGSRVYFNTRDQGGSAAGTRGEALSTNGAAGFIGPFTNRTSLVCPVVQGSLLRLSATDEGSSSNRILFACPNDPSVRENISIWSSTDETGSWGAPKPIYDGPSAYSDMVRTGVGEAGLLYEKGDASPYETITFTRFNEAWLDATATPAENPQAAFWNFEEKSAGQSANTNAGAILDVQPYSLTNNLTAQKAFAYINGSSNYGAGTALAFDGTGGLQISDAASSNHFDFGAMDAFTLEAVFRIPSGSSQTGALVAKDYGSLLPSWWLRVEAGKLRFLVCDGGVEVIVTANAPLVNDGLWHHAAAVRDTRIPTNKILRLYLDGVVLTNIVDTTSNSLANNQPVNIGRFGNSSTRNLTGDIDLVRITPKTLSPTTFVSHWTQFDADGDWIPDSVEKATYGSLGAIGTGDTDGDGTSDVLEYALATDPLSALSQPQMSLVLTTNSVTVTTRQQTLPPWLALQLEGSSNLTTWQAITNNPLLTPLGSNIFQRSQTVVYPGGRPATLFFRYQLNLLP